jgi:hypothetical protein
MGLFRRRMRGGQERPRASQRADEEHLATFARSRPGVEAFVEPPTAVTPCTVVFVAASGEWTRRRAASAETAHRLANRLGVPSYDAAVVGYPQRMREWTARRAAEQRAAEA